MSLEDILAETAALEEGNKATLGIKKAFDETPEKPSMFPHSIRYPVEGDFEYSLGSSAKTFHKFKIEVRVARGHLPEAEAVARPLIKKYRDLYAQNMGMNGTCESCLLVHYTYGPVESGEEKYVVVIFDVEAKEVESITVSV